MWWQWVWEGFVSGVSKLLSLWWVVGLFIVLQVVKDAGLFAKLAKPAYPLLRFLRLSDDAAVPLVAGLGAGITYGSGILIQAAEEGDFTREQLTVMCVFLGICHAIFEETALFYGAGLNGLLLLTIRFGTAFLFGGLATWWFNRRPGTVSVVGKSA
jgi:Fe2+ transport system protein B